MTVDDDCSCQCFPPQEPFELASEQPGVSSPRVPPAPPAPPPVTPAPPPPPIPPLPPPVIYTNPVPDNPGSRPDVDHDVGPRPVGPQDNPNRQGLSLTCPGDISLSTLDPTGKVVNFSVQAASGCTPVSLSVNPASGTKFPIGTTPVLAQASDSCANHKSCSFNVNIALATCPPVSSYPTIALAGGADTLVFDSARRIVYAGAGGGTVVSAFSTATQSMLASYPGTGGHPFGFWTLGYDAAHNCLASTDQHTDWVGIDLGTGAWSNVAAMTTGVDAGNFRQMAMDSADGIAMFSGINNGTNGAIQLVQYHSGISATSIYSSGYTLPILAEYPCYSTPAGKFLVVRSGGGPSFYYVDKLTGTLTPTGLALGALFGAILSVDSLGIVVMQTVGGVYLIIDPVNDALIQTTAVSSGFLLRAAEYQSCSKKLYLSDGLSTTVLDPNNHYALLQTIPTPYLSFVFDPFAGLMFAADGSSLVTTF
jgi:HYR domain